MTVSLGSRFVPLPLRVLAAAAFGLLSACGVAHGDETRSGLPALPAKLPGGAVLVQILEPQGSASVPRGGRAPSWEFGAPLAVTAEYTEPAFGFIGVLRKYSNKGIIIDRANPFVLRAAARVALPPGTYRVLLRSFNGARLRLDGRVIASTRFKSGNTDGHEAVPDLPQGSDPRLRPLGPGHTERLVELELDGRERVFSLEAIVGGKGLRQEVGELSVAVSANAGAEEGAEEEAKKEGGQPGAFQLLSAGGPAVSLSDAAWLDYASAARGRLVELNRKIRRGKSVQEDAYWRQRHERARRYEATLAPCPPPSTQEGFNPVDRFIGKRLAEAGIEAAPLSSDWAFLRRVSLDARGILPSPEEIESFLEDESPGRRSRFIDRMLESPRWADHWVSYWQDVLAENPGILKPKLNNTGPFRWWIYESFADNKPVDRFVTELILMEGSRYGGGPGGFAMATQNDVPMAAKAHIIGTAFLGVEMKCARCHDAPHHDSTQKDLFSLAAMLKRGAEEVPKTSSVPFSREELESMLIEVTLEPGSKVQPVWPFGDLVAAAAATGISRDGDDARARLAALVTTHENERFAKVIVNRLWKRYLGYGLVEPVDDWEAAEPSHPDLLEFLGRQLISHAYDLQHVARLILNSRTYQRQVRGAASEVPKAEERLFAGPARRRMTAEQLVDSLFHAVGKSFDSEELNLDVDGRRSVTSFLNLGAPRRAWEFATLSNERDRPALAIPAAQSILDLLQSFGWRETRQDPLTVRQSVATVRQPLILANGTVGHRITSLTDDGALTELCLKEGKLVDLIVSVFRSILTREPTDGELEMFTGLLAEGFEARVVRAEPRRDNRAGRKRHAVSWSNHLSAEATRIKMELERAVRQGDPPTRRLDPDWRERMEDMLWAMVNSPEFLFVP